MIGKLKTAHRPGFFTRFTSATADRLGRPGMFVLAGATIIVWAVSGPFLDFSDTWQLIINTLTTLITCLMVFIIQNTQNTQNRDGAAVHLKLDVIMRRLDVQDAGLYDAEHRSEAELEAENELITPAPTRMLTGASGAVPATEDSARIYLGASNAFPADLEELSLVELQVLHSRICRQLEDDYRSYPAGPPMTTLERYHDLVIELDYRHHGPFKNRRHPADHPLATDGTSDPATTRMPGSGWDLSR